MANESATVFKGKVIFPKEISPEKREIVALRKVSSDNVSAQFTWIFGRTQLQ